MWFYRRVNLGSKILVISRYLRDKNRIGIREYREEEQWYIFWLRDRWGVEDSEYKGIRLEANGGCIEYEYK